MDQSRYIDENDLPFTEDELFRAFALTEDEPVARDAARTLAERLSSGTYEGGSIADAGFAALALLSEDLRERVNTYMAARWEGMRWLAVRAALPLEGLPPASEPTPSALRAAETRLRGTWRIGGAGALRSRSGWGIHKRARVADEPPPWPGEDEG
jgi:hypothetical protein